MADRESNLVPFERGNQAALRHGGYSLLRLGPRAEEIAGELRDVMPAYSPGFEPAIGACAVVLAQLERASVILGREQASELERIRAGERHAPEDVGELQRLTRDAATWANTARRYLNDLGLSPSAASSLGLNIARARGEALRAHLAERYGADG